MIDGKRECDDCTETGSEYEPEGYVRPHFESLKALLLDHLSPTFDGIEYLHTHTSVQVWLDDPDDPRNSSSAVRMVGVHSSKVKNYFLIPIGDVSLNHKVDRNNLEGLQMHKALAAHFERFQRNG